MTLIFLLVLGLLIINYFFYRKIRQYNIYLYGLSLVIGIISMFFETNIINMGYVGLSFYIIVMFMTIMDKSEIKKRLMGNRAEYAIIGGIFAFTHGLKFILYALDYEFFFKAPINFYFGIASSILLIPLFITSFIYIRKKMKGKTWKKLHKLSYVFYTVIGLHVILIQNERFIFYISLFSIYIVLRLFTYYQVKHPLKQNKA